MYTANIIKYLCQTGVIWYIMILSTGSQWFSHRRIDQKQTRFGTFLAPPTGWRPTDPYKKGPPTAIHKMLESQSSLRTPLLLVEPRDSYANAPWKNNLRFSELHVIFHGFGTSNHLTFVLLEAYTCMWCSSITQDSTEVINDSSLSLSLCLSCKFKHFQTLHLSIPWNDLGGHPWSFVRSSKFRTDSSSKRFLSSGLLQQNQGFHQKRANPRGQLWHVECGKHRKTHFNQSMMWQTPKRLKMTKKSSSMTLWFLQAPFLVSKIHSENAASHLPSELQPRHWVKPALVRDWHCRF